MGGAWSCCLPCAGGGGRGAPGGGPGVASCGGSNRQVKKPSVVLCGLPHRRRQHQKGTTSSDTGSTCLEQDLDDLEDLDEAVEAVVIAGCFAKRSQPQTQDDNTVEGGTQHRLSPRLHDIKEEDDEECRYTRER